MLVRKDIFPLLDAYTHTRQLFPPSFLLSLFRWSTSTAGLSTNLLRLSLSYGLHYCAFMSLLYHTRMSNECECGAQCLNRFGSAWYKSLKLLNRTRYICGWTTRLLISTPVVLVVTDLLIYFLISVSLVVDHLASCRCVQTSVASLASCIYHYLVKLYSSTNFF